MATKVAVLGGGLVGGFIARELSKYDDIELTLHDRSEEVLAACSTRAELATQRTDLRDMALVREIAGASELVMGAVPGSFGYAVLENVIATGTDCIDISFFPEEAAALNMAAQHSGSRVVVDCGVMPGLGGMLAARFARQFDEPLSMRILVGGLPEERLWPFEYRAPFSPADVIEEYVRPARYLVNGELVTVPALSGQELLDFPGIGTLEAFNTDGLRSIMATLPYPSMIEQTLRYPGHAEKMRMLRELGFFGEQPVETVRGNRVVPLELTSSLLFDNWKLTAGMRELTVMRVEATGIRNGAELKLCCDLLDRTDPDTGDFSMARTTGLPAVLCARMLLAGKLGVEPGVTAPETIGFDETRLNYIIRGMQHYGVQFEFSEA
ncbi:saccharopine dehydrogenase NADP-binding domain-containing protein [bacterium]|nr:saccharopine dehydrogenase NADP-binding domain-containing protein [bacterium]